ncbi:hypothetical protein [Halobacteriovorax sp. HLS]|uniref:hypothetical protein n=1 Tax=Halobacteriovorax sp. HLS TaxID=2234000 RepID=UPI000FDB8FCC|nr:hypothetical protein [Halobacteriovorax sp. HLS]
MAVAKIKLTDRDFCLFLFLFKYKAASVTQIKQFCYPTSEECNLRKRLKKLENNHFIDFSSFYHGKRFQKIFHLTDKGIEKLRESRPLDLIRKQLKSDSIEHDLPLIYIGESLKQSKNVLQYYSENQIQCLEDFTDDDLTSQFVKLHSDGYALIKFDDERYHGAIEFERSEKKSTRYEQLVIDYYISSAVDVVLYFSKTDSIIKQIKHFEELHYQNLEPKFYFLKLESELKLIDKIIFKNRKGQKLEF